MRRLIVGTAGHVDHGKTRLVEALTGIDCDRWEQEKERGITIDLGFAHLETDDLQLGFVDVPGHERFLHNALAGLGGVRVLLLVVAADEGVKPQTREHLEICSLLPIPAALVALTKSDLVSSDLLELAELEVAELLADGPFAGAPVCAVSSTTGEGVAELRDALLEIAGRHALAGTDERPARLPIDRAFVLKGAGVVVTGTLASGCIGIGDALDVLPGGGAVRVRSIQVHGEARERADAGERTSLQLAGSELGALGRGSQLVAPGAFEGSRELLVRCRLLAADGARGEAERSLSGFTPVRVHHFSSEVMGKMRPLAPSELAPGGEGLVELRLSAPLVAVRGDALVLRRPSPAATLGGGEVLDPSWKRARGGALSAALDALGGDDERAVRHWVQREGETGVTAAQLARRLGVGAETVARRLADLAAAGRLLTIPATQARYVAPVVLRRVQQRAERALDAYLAQNRLARGLPKAQAVQRILPPPARRLAGIYLDWLAAAGVLEIAGDLVTRPGHRAELDEGESKLARRVQRALSAAGLQPPSPAELARELGAKPQILDGVVGYLVERGKLLKLPNGLILSADAVDAIERELRGAGWERFDVGRFKQRFGLSRKWAIPLLEHLDSTGVTRRVGDERMVVRT